MLTSFVAMHLLKRVFYWIILGRGAFVRCVYHLCPVLMVGDFLVNSSCGYPLSGIAIIWLE